MQTWRLACLAAILATMARPAGAQVIGTFRWQLLPYCNVTSLTVTQQGAQYLLDGTDDQCGTGAAAARGLGYLNPNGTVGFGFTVLTTPGGLPVHIDATLNVPSLGGTWRDSDGRSGAFLFLVGAPAVGAARPAASAGAGATKAASFGIVAITSAQTPTAAPDLVAVTFTAPYTGIAVASGTGYCLANSISTGGSSTIVTTTVNGAEVAFPQGIAYSAVISMPQSASVIFDTKPWAVQRDFPVVAGTVYTAAIRAYRGGGPSAVVSCAGNMNVRVHSGVLP